MPTLKNLLLRLSMIFRLNTSDLVKARKNNILSYMIIFIVSSIFMIDIQASAIIVNTYKDSNTTGQCSLRSAILAANTDSSVEGCDAGEPGLDTIKLRKGGYQVLSDLPQITDSLAIYGEGQDITSLWTEDDYGSSVAAHYFYFRPSSFTGKTFLLKGMTMYTGTKRNGTSGGGCVNIYGSHQVTLDHVTLSNCSSGSSTTGGALLFYTRSSVTNVIAELNLLWSDILAGNTGLGNGNGVYSDGGGLYLSDVINFNMTNSSVKHNKGNLGGGIMISVGSNPNNLISEVNILRSVITDNKAHTPATTTTKGGGIYIDGNENNFDDNIINVSIKHSKIAYNWAQSTNGEGAGIYLRGANITVDLENTYLAKNSSGNPPTQYYYDYYLGFNMGTSSSFNAIGTGFAFSPSAWSLIGDLDDPSIANVNKDYTHINSIYFSVQDKGYCDNEPYDYRGFGLIVGSSPIRTVDDLAIPNDNGAGCDIGAYETDAVPVVDYDGDGVLDANDTFPLNGAESMDTDNDNIGNNEDLDDDNDGYLDVIELSEGSDPLDASSKPLDTDGDFIPNSTDTDDDNDGISDVYEISLGFDPLDASSTPLDTDGDGTPNALDADDDNDGISDSDEATLGFNPLNASDGLADTDGDGFSNAMEFNIGTNMNDATDKPIWTPIMMNDIMIFIPAKP